MNTHSIDTHIGHVHLYVADLTRSLSFYREVIGLQLLRQQDRVAELTADGKRPILIIEQQAQPLPKQPRTTGLYHFAILVPSRQDLAHTLTHLLHTGYPLQGAADHQFSEAIYLSDPDGNGIELYADRPRSEWVWSDGELPFVSDPLDGDGLLAAADDTPWTGLPSGAIIGHVHLHVADLQAAKTFYCDGLGLDITIPFRNRALFVSAGGYHHHIGLNTWNGEGAPAPAPESIGLKWFSLVFPDDAERQQVLQRLAEIGAPVKTDNEIPFTCDPSGNHIQLITSR